MLKYVGNSLAHWHRLGGSSKGLIREMLYILLNLRYRIVIWQAHRCITAGNFTLTCSFAGPYVEIHMTVPRSRIAILFEERAAFGEVGGAPSGITAVAEMLSHSLVKHPCP